MSRNTTNKMDQNPRPTHTHPGQTMLKNIRATSDDATDKIGGLRAPRDREPLKLRNHSRLTKYETTHRELYPVSCDSPIKAEKLVSPAPWTDPAPVDAWLPPTPSIDPGPVGADIGSSNLVEALCSPLLVMRFLRRLPLGRPAWPSTMLGGTSVVSLASIHKAGGLMRKALSAWTARYFLALYPSLIRSRASAILLIADKNRKKYHEHHRTERA